ncbi:MAG: D-aminoacylase, partial [Chloroflexi bacterium]|nr:D-aminoacylase [Chloroflexota bacterium]
MVDLLIKNGLIIDGSGSPGYFGTVTVDNERIAIHRGDVPQVDAARVIDATDHV